VRLSAVILKGELTKVPPVTLTLAPATLSITDGTAGAEVYVDNVLIGRSSAAGGITYQTTPGKHRVQLRKAEFEDGRVVDLDFTAGSTTPLPTADVTLRPFGWIEFKVGPATANATIRFRPATGPASQVQNNETQRVKAGRYFISVSANGYQPIEDSIVEVEPGKGTPFSRTLTANSVAGRGAEPPKPVIIGKEGFANPQPQIPYRLFRQRMPGTYSFTIKSRRTLFQKRAKWVVNYIDDKNYVEYEIDEKNLKYTTRQNGKEQTRSVPHRLNGLSGDAYEMTVAVSPNAIVISCAGQRIDIQTPEGVGNLVAGQFGFHKDESPDLETFRFEGQTR
jgi:hypothetical protein